MPKKNLPPSPSNFPEPFLKIVTSSASIGTKNLIVGVSNLVRSIEKRVSLFPSSDNKAELKRLVSGVGRLIDKLLEDEEDIDDMKTIAHVNVDIMNHLQAANMDLGRRAKTILEAVLNIEKNMTNSSAFPKISAIRIILSPVLNERGRLMENPIAQMLADTLSIMEDQIADKDFVMTPDEQAQQRKMEYIASLLPLTQNAIRPKSTQLIPLLEEARKKRHVSSHLKKLPTDTLFTGDKQRSHILSIEEIQNLDKKIFGEVGSALAHPIVGVGEILFISKDPKHFNTNLDTLLIGNAVEMMGMILEFIGKSENNQKDLLTGLPMRRHFEEKTHKLLEQAREQKEEVSFVLIDADHFKKVNDQYGHPAGDLVLKTLARLLIQKLKTEDIKVRWGGEEFGVFMQTTPADAARALGRVFEDMKNIVFQVDKDDFPSISHGYIDPDSRAFSITLSAGIIGSRDKISIFDAIKKTTHYVPMAEVQLEHLVHAADKRLYAAKHAGRDCIVFQDSPSVTPSK